MRPRTFILIILVLLVAIVGGLLALAFTAGTGPLAGLVGGNDDQPAIVDGGDDGVSEDGGDGVSAPAPLPTPTRSIVLEPVIIAKTDLPIGTQLRPDLLDVEFRPDSNIALQGNYTYAEDEIEELIGEYVKVPISKGQAILRPMLALNPSDLGQFGSDLALYVSSGQLAVAFPIDTFTGAAYAMRPGDFVDVLMTLTAVRSDDEFNTALPNLIETVDAEILSEGGDFLSGSPAIQGRLELIPELDLVAEIVPGSNVLPGMSPGQEIPRRVTQLTIQQSEVLWVGTWDPTRNQPDEPETPAEEGGEGDGASTSIPTPTPQPQRVDNPPDVVILSMPAQDALALKWAMEVGLSSTLVLRAQGDNTTFSTTSVSLPQIVEQGGLIRPEPGEFLLSPAWEDVPVPELPLVAPGSGR